MAEDVTTFGDDEAEDAGSAAAKLSLRTPLFGAINADRYSRQALIRDIQADTGAKLLCYVAGRAASLTRDDVMGLVDMLHRVPHGSNIDFLLQTPGGEIDAAEKMANMLRRHVSDAGTLRVIVPDYAKSAGTLISLAADTIVMSESSELGPIDPQMPLPQGDGRYRLRPAQAYVDGYEKLLERVNANPGSPAYEQMLAKYDPTLVEIAGKALIRSQRMAEEQLQRGMYRTGGNWTALASALSDNKKWLQHSVPIDYLQAKQLQMEITYLEPTDSLWQKFWALYCLQRLAGNAEDVKLFESDYVSIPLT